MLYIQSLKKHIFLLHPSPDQSTVNVLLAPMNNSAKLRHYIYTTYRKIRFCLKKSHFNIFRGPKKWSLQRKKKLLSLLLMNNCNEFAQLSNIMHPKPLGLSLHFNVFQFDQYRFPLLSRDTKYVPSGRMHCTLL